MKIFAALVGSVALACTAAAQMEYTNCATTPTQFQMTSADWSPSPACIGKDLCAEDTLTDLFTPTTTICVPSLLPRVGVVFQTVATNGDGGTLFCTRVQNAQAKICA
ncbi:hypothetical protein BGZ68_005034 [Mortierella alpina]|nr:hypothetical protein BGZ68_005034 [Mortierella alpina]